MRASQDAGRIVEGADGNSMLIPAADPLIGGVRVDAPEGAIGQMLRSPEVHGALALSKPTATHTARFGTFFRGAVGLMPYAAGHRAGIPSPRTLRQAPTRLVSARRSA